MTEKEKENEINTFEIDKIFGINPDIERAMSEVSLPPPSQSLHEIINNALSKNIFLSKDNYETLAYLMDNIGGSMNIWVTRENTAGEVIEKPFLYTQYPIRIENLMNFDSALHGIVQTLPKEFDEENGTRFRFEKAVIYGDPVSFGNIEKREERKEEWYCIIEMNDGSDKERCYLTFSFHCKGAQTIHRSWILNGILQRLWFAEWRYYYLQMQSLASMRINIRQFLVTSPSANIYNKFPAMLLASELDSMVAVHIKNLQSAFSRLQMDIREDIKKNCILKFNQQIK